MTMPDDTGQDCARCVMCGVVLTAEEIHYYDASCNDCEGEWEDRMRRYREGAEDPMLDLLFSA